MKRSKFVSLIMIDENKMNKKSKTKQEKTRIQFMSIGKLDNDLEYFINILNIYYLIAHFSALIYKP